MILLRDAQNSVCFLLANVIGFNPQHMEGLGCGTSPDLCESPLLGDSLSEFDDCIKLLKIDEITGHVSVSIASKH